MASEIPKPENSSELKPSVSPNVPPMAERTPLTAEQKKQRIDENFRTVKQLERWLADGKASDEKQKAYHGLMKYLRGRINYLSGRAPQNGQKEPLDGKCAKCGTEKVENFAFCPKCGNKFN